jgi:hypothetical protein
VRIASNSDTFCVNAGTLPVDRCYAAAMAMYLALFAFDLLAVLTSGLFLDEDSMPVLLPIVAAGIMGLVAASVMQAQGRKRSATLLLGAFAVPPAGLALFYGFVSATGGFHH